MGTAFKAAALLALMTAGGVWAATPAAAQEKAVEAATDAGKTVVARVDGEPIHLDRLNQAMQTFGRDLGQLEPEAYYRTVMDRLIDQELAARAGVAAGLEDDPEVQARLADIRANVLAGAYLRKVAEDATDEPALRRRYEAVAKEGVKQIHARHILLQTEEEAKDAIQALKEGADFAELAEVRSVGPSAKSGGDLGYFKKEQMVKPFADAAFALEKGAITETPVETQFGWHVIKVEDIKSDAPPPFYEMQEELRQQAATEAMIGALDALRGNAK
ncbi:MAG: peptidylprolyl isomerase, partial [Alphaproteobacteria bacterium]